MQRTLSLTTLKNRNGNIMDVRLEVFKARIVVIIYWKQTQCQFQIRVIPKQYKWKMVELFPNS